MNTVSLVALAAKRTATALEQRGLVASLAKELWLKSHSTPAEFAEHTQIADALVLETIASSDAAEILFCDDGSYPYVSQLLRDRIEQRTQAFGSVMELISDPDRRHLIQLSIPEQRFGMMLERSNSTQVDMYLEFMATLDIARQQELLRLRLETEKLNEPPLHEDRHRIPVREMLRKSFLLRNFDGGYTTYSPEREGEVAAIFVDGKAKVHFHLVHSPHGSTGNCCGSISLKSYIRNESFGKRTADPNVRLMFYFTALSGALLPYQNFNSSAELAVCCIAWSTAATVLAEEFRLDGMDVVVAIPSAR